MYGLHDIVCAYSYIFADAPFTGARIETEIATNMQKKRQDAPFTGARIETTTSAIYPDADIDAPFTGARIETRSCQGSRTIRAGCPLHGGKN